MPDNNKKKFSILTKIKNIKNIEIIASILLGVIVLVIFIGGLNPSESKSETTYNSTKEYVAETEKKVAKVLSQIKGVGKASVVLSVKSGIQEVYLTENESKTETNPNGLKEVFKTEKPVYVNGKVVKLKDVYPTIEGVVVVCNGGGNSLTKIKIIEAINVLLNVSSEKVSVFAKK